MATKEDHLAALREQTPPLLYRFAEVLAADPQMDAARAALAVGRAGAARDLLADPRTLRVLSAIFEADSEALKSQRQQGIRMLVALCSYDPGLAYDPASGRHLALWEIPPALRVAITGYTLRDDGTIKSLKFVSRLEALKLLFMHFGDLDNVAATAATAKIVMYRD